MHAQYLKPLKQQHKNALQESLVCHTACEVLMLIVIICYSGSSCNSAEQGSGLVPGSPMCCKRYLRPALLNKTGMACPTLW